MSKLITDLDPDVQDLCLEFLQLCARRGILLKITHTHRTFEEQDALYAQGRTKPGARVTAASAGWSWHNWRRAFDVAQVGKDPYPASDAFWYTIGEIGESVGLEWGGRWKNPDRPHFQHTGGKTLAALRAQAKSEGQLA